MAMTAGSHESPAEALASIVKPKLDEGRRDAPPITVNGFGIFRFALAATVLWMHYEKLAFGHPTRTLIEPFEIGSIAVLVFFVLSGYVISNAIDVHYEGRPGAFLVNRFYRIAPTFYAVLLLSVIVLAPVAAAGLLTDGEGNAVSPRAFSLANLAKNVLEIVPLSHKVAPAEYSFIPIFWAVRIELMFYLAAAACIFVAATLGTRFVRIGFVVGALAIGLGAVESTTEIFGFPTFRLAPHFALGAALYYLRRSPSGASALLAAAGLAAVMLDIFSRELVHATSGFERNLEGQALLLLTALGVFAVLVYRGPRRSAVADYLGALSYPVYLAHILPLHLAASFGAIQSPSWSWLVPAAAAALVLAVLIERFVEVPAARLRAKVRRPPHL